jgi:D-serine deaminase-like pyridoxal phosphate-dependent protein
MIRRSDRDMNTLHARPLSAALAALDTPALLVNLAVLDANIARIAGACRAYGVKWRPHIKENKTPEIVARQMAAGAIGVTCAKLGEAEVMAAAGITNILIANQVVGRTKIERLARLREIVDPIVAVDSLAHIEALETGGFTRNRRLRIVVEIDVGMKRAGVAPGRAAIGLADAIAGHPGLQFVGLMAWESQAVRIADGAEKRRVVREALAELTATAALCHDAGHAIAVVSCGGSGTFPYCIEQPGITEVQIGGAAFSDMCYRDQYHLDFPPALTVLATVTSRPTPTRIILDAGRKSLLDALATPAPLRLPPVASIKLSAEHATLELAAPSEPPRVGDPIELIVGYGDMTVFLHDEIVAHRNGKLEAVWRIAARGQVK